MFRKKKRFGQHFLKDQGVLRQICAYTQLSPGQHCVEIGPGQGALTKHLIGTGANIHAIELDDRLLQNLQVFVSKHPNFAFTMGDVLDVNLQQIIPKDKSVKVVGNLPYEISTPLLFRLVEFRHCIDRMVFLLQKEVVDRIVASVGSSHYGRLSVMMQYYFRTEGLLVVPPDVFDPPPKVMSQVVKLEPVTRDWVDHDQLSSFVKYLFAQKRKMLRQRFKGYLDQNDWETLDIDATHRPGELSIDEILRMMQLLTHKGIYL